MPFDDFSWKQWHGISLDITKNPHVSIWAIVASFSSDNFFINLV
jgi:hypothetical protein